MEMKIDIVKCENLTQSERTDMYSIFSRYYDNVNLFRFETDLKKKNWVIQLRNQSKSIVGFSTLEIYRHLGVAGSAMILYSGDTIIDRAYRRNGDLAGAFGHIILKAIREYSDMPIYWLLTSKGVRTYRFLPVFFNIFYPIFNKQTPENIKLLIHEIALEKFGSKYSPETQVIYHNEKRDYLRASEHDSLLLKRSDPYIHFFLQQNPGYIIGDELVCIAEISEKNLNSRACRVINHTEVYWRE
ncbi:MAG: hypothetical protein KJ915_04525 [Candidatus Omnitrophica bacterium]|nr:hypothetical protein [Candidatus Omnitrophota bacterium]